MKIVRLSAENIKRISAVEITPDGNLVVVGGSNGQGKTSVLDSIMMALGGKYTIPSKPVKRGNKSGSVEIELDEDFVIKRTINEDGTGKLEVSSKAGARYQSPQTLLDGFAAKFSFDPLAFKQMKPAEQAELLRNVLGLDFSDLDRRRQSTYVERTIVNRNVKKLESQLSAATFNPRIPERVDTAGLVAELQESNKRNQYAAKVETDKRMVDNQIESTKREMDSIEKRLSELREKSVSLDTHRRSLSKIDTSRVDTSEIEERLAQASNTNATVERMEAENNASKQLRQLLDKETEVAKQLTASIAAIDAEKSSRLQSAHFPVEGMSVDDVSVTFDGIPFDQLSGAEQLRVSVAMGIALNPKLRVLLVRDGSLLDDANLKLLAELAEQHDCQVWLERVGSGDEVGIVIEDGTVKETRALAHV